MIVMAQELVLIPKEEYESLLSKQKNAPDHRTTEQDEATDTKYSIEHDEAQLQEPAGKKNLESVKDIVQEPKSEMKGTGKKYVTESIEKFLKLATQSKRKKRQTKNSKSKRNLIKQKWIHY